jgi:hypothetical protein
MITTGHRATREQSHDGCGQLGQRRPCSRPCDSLETVRDISCGTAGFGFSLCLFVNEPEHDRRGDRDTDQDHDGRGDRPEVRGRNDQWCTLVEGVDLIPKRRGVARE